MPSTITIEDAQNQPWLAMVHGMSQDHRYFSKQVERFRPHYRILLIDLPGHGLSSMMHGPYGHLEFARHVEQILDTPTVAPVHYWGTHTGGTVGVLLGLERPSLFRSLLLESPSVPGQNPKIVTELLSAARAKAREAGIEAALEQWWQSSCWFDQIRANPDQCRAAEHLEIVSEFSGQPWIEEADTKPVPALSPATSAPPSLIYQGEFDHPDFGEAARDVCRLLVGSEHQVLPGLGGFPAWEAPDEVNAVAAQLFLDTDRRLAS